MKKSSTTSPADDNIWDSTSDVEETPKTKAKTKVYVEETPVKAAPPKAENAGNYDLEGLMTDFPTAKDLERFVYDETGIVLNLKGRANKLKYQVAMDTLNGEEIEQHFIGRDNPYVDKSEMIPEEPLKPVPARDKNLPDHKQVQNSFYSPMIPHPDSIMRARDKKCHVMFRKYNTGEISYEILGPLEQHPFGEKIDKFGRARPEIMKWTDPRTGEQIAVREDGSFTPQGKRLRAMMQTGKFRVNKSNQWAIWVDREFASINENVALNPWDISK
jgi:hypothetical protein